MMDEQTRKELRKISLGVPEKLQKNLERTEIDTSQEDILKQYVKDNRHSMPVAKARELERVIASGALRTKEKVVDEKVAKEIDEYNRVKVQRAREQGKLADPEKDAWYKRRMEQIKGHK